MLVLNQKSVSLKKKNEASDKGQKGSLSEREYQEFTPHGWDEIPQNTLPEALSKPPTEETYCRRQDAAPANVTKEQGTETWGSEYLEKSGKRELRSASQHLPRAIQGRGCQYLILQTGNSHVIEEDITPSEWHSRGSGPKGITQVCLFLCPHYLMQ